MYIQTKEEIKAATTEIEEAHQNRSPQVQYQEATYHQSEAVSFCFEISCLQQRNGRSCYKKCHAASLRGKDFLNPDGTCNCLIYILDSDIVFFETEHQRILGELDPKEEEQEDGVNAKTFLLYTKDKIGVQANDQYLANPTATKEYHSNTHCLSALLEIISNPILESSKFTTIQIVQNDTNSNTYTLLYFIFDPEGCSNGKDNDHYGPYLDPSLSPWIKERMEADMYNPYPEWQSKGYSMAIWMAIQMGRPSRNSKSVFSTPQKTHTLQITATADISILKTPTAMLLQEFLHYITKDEACNFGHTRSILKGNKEKKTVNSNIISILKALRATIFHGSLHYIKKDEACKFPCIDPLSRLEGTDST
eukprot:jgi/Psemu1/1531/gm1.1531_g